jgi:hypothetical protein
MQQSKGWNCQPKAHIWRRMQIENIYPRMKWCEHFSTKTNSKHNIFFIYSQTCNIYCTILFYHFEWKENLLLEKSNWPKQNQKNAYGNN